MPTRLTTAAILVMFISSSAGPNTALRINLVPGSFVCTGSGRPRPSGAVAHAAAGCARKQRDRGVEEAVDPGQDVGAPVRLVVEQRLQSHQVGGEINYEGVGDCLDGVHAGPVGAHRVVGTLVPAEGVYVIGFSYPVVPKGKARIRTQMSAAHTAEQIDRAVAAFAKVGKALGVIR